MSEDRAAYIAQSLDDNTCQETSTPQYRDPVKNIGFAQIPHILSLDAGLSDGAYRTYAILIYHWQRKDAAWVGIETLSKERSVKPSTVSKHLKELVDAGLISRQRRMGQSSVTFLEDLPERFAEAASMILDARKERQKSRGKSSRNLEVNPLALSTREEEQVEKEQSEEEQESGETKNVSPTPEEDDPKAKPSILDEKSALALDVDSMPAAPVSHSQSVTPTATPEHYAAIRAAVEASGADLTLAGVASPVEDERSFVRHYAPVIAGVMGRGKPIDEDRRTAKKIYRKRIDRARLDERLAAYGNGEGAEFRKPEAIADWIVGRLERDLTPRRATGAQPSYLTAAEYEKRLSGTLRT